MEKDSAISRCKGLSLSREFLPLSPLHHLAGEFNLVVVESHSKKMDSHQDQCERQTRMMRMFAPNAFLPSLLSERPRSTVAVMKYHEVLDILMSKNDGKFLTR